MNTTHQTKRESQKAANLVHDALLKINAITAALILTAGSALGAGLSSTTVNRLADAIYRVEGGARAKAPYGILSVRVSSTDDARRICTNTIRNNHNRWIRAGRPGEYLDFLADRYCPPSADPNGNRNWKRNIRKISGLDF